MEKRLPLSDKAGKSKVKSGKSIPLVNDTKMTSDTIIPEENDPLWEESGSTRIVPGNNEKPGILGDADSASNFTEFSPSRILGKNVLGLGDYQFLAKLGEGAMGVVYKAKHISKDRIVALKVLFPHVANNPNLVERLRREGLTMGLLDHPNIVQAYAVDEADGCHFIAMEYVSGKSMQSWLTQLGQLPVPDAVHIILVCTRALAYAHSQGVLHRDIKPDNILLTDNGAVKVADLGMVKNDSEEMSLTQTGHAVGTPWYMPLEQARNAKEIEGTSDIYALGCTLYALLTGKPPFSGRTIVDVFKAKEVGTFPPARQSNAEVPERLDLVIAKMTAKLPKHRHQNCEEVIKDLERLNLAGEFVSFLQDPSLADPAEQDEETAVSMMKATVRGAIVPSKAQPAAESEAVLDPNLWYVQVKIEGRIATQKFTTAQLRAMLAESKIKQTAKVSHSPNQGFHSLATFKEFQGIVAKKEADKQSVRFRGVMEQLKEKERLREEKESAGQEEETEIQANLRYWVGVFLTVLPCALGLILIGFLMWLLAKSIL